MIARLRGTLVSKSPGRVIVEVGGVGYQVFVPLSTYYHLPESGEEVLLYTSTYVRDDVIVLYGFRTEEEKGLFELLQGVSGIGPRLATNILSGISTEELIPAISKGDVARLKAIPGVGRKTAERLVLELKEKLADRGKDGRAAVSKGKDQALEDVISALVNLGCDRKEAAKAAEEAREALGVEAGFESLVKFALKVISHAK
ncbi:MAG: Holliday junction branch migration protein RuvA [candidate division NC10 bacterium]|nr:Holliday junction branch migration protein RuvA [candidate division NC10 bacterium]